MPKLVPLADWFELPFLSFVGFCCSMARLWRRNQQKETKETKGSAGLLQSGFDASGRILSCALPISALRSALRALRFLLDINRFALLN